MRLLATALLLLACFHSDAYSTLEYRGCPARMTNSLECSAYLDAQLLKKFPELFSRTERSLTIRLANQNTVIFSDREAELNAAGAVLKPATRITIDQYFPEVGYAVVLRQGSEFGEGYLFNMKTGQQTLIAEHEVVLSPDKKRFASAKSDYIIYDTGLLLIHAIAGDSLIEEFRLDTRHEGPMDLRWLNNEQLTFSMDSIKPDVGQIQTPKLLRYQDQSAGKWVIADR